MHHWKTELTSELTQYCHDITILTLHHFDMQIRYPEHTVGALGEDICVIAFFVQWDWTSISTSCIFFKIASFPISVFHLQCHSVPLLLTVLTSDIVSVPQSLTSNPLCPWTVLNVRNVHTLKADRLKKSLYTIICCTLFNSSPGLLCGFWLLSLCLCGYFPRCFGYFNGPKICTLGPTGPENDWQPAQGAQAVVKRINNWIIISRKIISNQDLL